MMKWDTVIQEKVSELGRYLSDRCRRLDFYEPIPLLERTDKRAIREGILALRQIDARKLGIGKSTLHYLRKSANQRLYFTVQAKTIERLQNSGFVK